ncbi:MAG: PDZ domain-containing protein [Verrucomicrobiales bacterium]|nr:PDZ domain-containing protein [Verrucomicrobiales bacterium]
MKLKQRLLAVVAGVLCVSSGLAQDKDKPQPPKEMRTWLGVASAEVHPVLRQHLDLKEGFGVQISHIPEDSPAGKAGLKPGDVLSMLDDQYLTTPEHLAILVRSKEKGESIELTYLRKGAEMKTTVELGEMEMPKEDYRRPGFPRQSAEQWKEWHEGMRQKQEEMQRRMQDMHRERNPERFRFEDHRGDRDRPRMENRNPRERRDPPSRPEIKNESTVKIDNDQGDIVISRKDGKGRIEINDAEGNEVYSGPYDVEKGIEGLPEKARDHLKKMKVDRIDMLAPAAPKREAKEEADLDEAL